MKILKKNAGTSLPITLMFFMVMGMVTVVTVGLTQTTDSMVYRGALKVQANELAESGVQTLYDEVCRKMKNGSILNQDVKNLTLNSTMAGESRNLGSFEAKVTDVTFTDTPNPAGHPTGTLLRKYRFQLEGKGTAVNGTESVIMASFTGEIVAANDAFTDPMKEWILYPAAMQSNSNVYVKADSGVRTLDVATVDKEAHIMANRGVTWQPATNSKSAYSAPDIVSVDGHILVPNQPVDTFYNTTMSSLGLGNYNGIKNYQSAGPWINKTNTYPVVANEVTPMGHDLPFPSAAQVNAWQNTWKHTATTHAATTIHDRVSSNSLPISNGIRTINAPAYFEDGLDVEKDDTVHLIPLSDDPADNIVYVDGDISNMGNIVNHGVTFVTSARYFDSADATYNLDKQYTKYPDLSDVYKNSGLISLAGPETGVSDSSSASIWIQSDVDGKYGLVYAVNGSIKITGNLEMNAILVSGTPELSRAKQASIQSSTVMGGIHIEPKGGKDFTLTYVRDTKGFTLPGRLVDSTKVVVPFRAAALTDWMQKM